MTERAEHTALDPLEMLLDAARYAEGNCSKYRNLEWAKAARAAVAKARLAALDHGGADAGGDRSRSRFQQAVFEAMQDAWNDICSDTGCHPNDLKQQGRKLFFQPDHWAAQIARLLFPLSKPAPVAAHASAEARLREVLSNCHDFFADIVGGAEVTERSVQHAKGLIEALRALSAHPHASDCARPPLPSGRFRSNYDGFIGEVVGDYETKQGEKGLVLQQDEQVICIPCSDCARYVERLCTVCDAVIGSKSRSCQVCGIEQPSDHASDCDKQGER